jgi:hypothetical protein
MFLFLDKQTNKVFCTSEGMTRPEVQKVFQADKTKDKSHFNSVITAIYWIYRPRGLYWGKPLLERIKIVSEDYHIFWDKLVKEPGVKSLADCFIDLTSTLNDRAYDNLRNDFEELMQSLNQVPTHIDIEIPIDTDVTCADGVHKTTKATKISIPTFEQKLELWKQYETFSKILKSVQTLLKLEDEERVKAGTDVYLFDGQVKEPIKIE